MLYYVITQLFKIKIYSYFRLTLFCLQVISTNSISGFTNSNHIVSTLPEPIGKGRSNSTSSSITSSDSSGFYQRAPGSERDDYQVPSLSGKILGSFILIWLSCLSVGLYILSTLESNLCSPQ